MVEVNEFTGILRFTPKYAKCDPITVQGHWTLKDIGKPWKVWCNEGIWKHGINETICEIIAIHKRLK